jgi:hypothetical protein
MSELKHWLGGTDTPRPEGISATNYTLFSKTHIPTNHETISGYDDVNDQCHGLTVVKVLNWNIPPCSWNFFGQLVMCGSEFFSHFNRNVSSIFTPRVLNTSNHSFVDCGGDRAVARAALEFT